MEGTSKARRLFRRLTVIAWIVFALGMLSVPTFLYLVSIDFAGWFGGLPTYKDLENPESDLSSEIISADGEVLGRYYRENRTPIEFEELNPRLVQTLLAVEDLRFEDHAGVDLKGLLRAIASGGSAGGGSTITQQLAKNLFRTRGSTLSKGTLTETLPFMRIPIAKTKEWLLAVQLERNFTKREIIAMFLNTIEFGSNSFGIYTASQTFFNTTPDSLDWRESAMLVGMLNAPTAYNPYRNPEAALRKRDQILYKIARFDAISEELRDSLLNMGIGLEYKPGSHNEGLATYFRATISRDLMRWCADNGYDLWEDGLKIYTTIDSRLQAHAEAAVAEHMTKLQELFREHWEGRGDPWRNEDGKVIPNFLEQIAARSPTQKAYENRWGKGHDSVQIMMNTPRPIEVFTWDGVQDSVMTPMDSIRHYKTFLHAGLMAMDPATGHVRAWVGGINHRYFQYDHVAQGARQPGSTFKPFVYASAVENEIPPCLPVLDAEVTFKLPSGDTWTPKNANNQYSRETMTLRRGLATSTNSITAYVMKNYTSPEAVVELAHRMGVKSELDAVPALCLGVSNVTLREMVGAYSTFVNGGTWKEPIYITRIEDKNGNVLEEFIPNSKQALSERSAYIMLQLLKGTVEEGTALGLDWDLKKDNEIAAKTGTTQRHSDGWFIGITQNLSAGVWVGGDEPSISFRTIALGQGARMAMPIWEKFMQRVYDDETLGIRKGPFRQPNVRLGTDLNCEVYQKEDEFEIDENGDTIYVAPPPTEETIDADDVY